MNWQTFSTKFIELFRARALYSILLSSFHFLAHSIRSVCDAYGKS